MSWMAVAAAACVFVAAAICWNLAAVAVLRIPGIELSFSLPFHLFRRRAPEVLAALGKRTINTYVAVSGLLLFAAPLFAGLLAYDRVVHRYESYSALKYFLTAAAWLLLLVILGVRVSLGQWQKRVESGNGLPMLAILALKVSTDLTGGLTAAVVLTGAALFCSFLYFGVRRITGALGGKQYPARRDTPVQQNFVSERFVPGETPAAEKVAMVQKLMASSGNADVPFDESRDDEHP